MSSKLSDIDLGARAAPSPDLAALVPMPFGDRVERVRRVLPEAGCDALVVSDLVNVRWLTGFTGSNAMVVVDHDEVVFVTDGRYGEQAEREIAILGARGAVRLEIVSGRAEQGAVVGSATRDRARIALEADVVTWSDQLTYAGEWFAGSELVATTSLIADLRRVKDAGEVARLRAAAAVADDALDAVQDTLAAGPTEREFATLLDRTMVDLGAEGPSFETICASGPNSALPHARPSDRHIGEAELVVLDFGALVDGYHSDMTRTLIVGDPGPDELELLEAATAAQARGAAAVRPGVTADGIDRACRDELASRGLEDLLLHGTGHGVGLEIHETPIFRPGADAKLAVGEVVTVEPGVYRPRTGGARVEDTVLVTPGGCQALTRFPKNHSVTQR